MYIEDREMAHQAPFLSSARWRPLLLNAIRAPQKTVGKRVAPQGVLCAVDPAIRGSVEGTGCAHNGVLYTDFSDGACSV